ncbi:MAG: CDC27 family protein [Campylobacteraceae bacterium]|jgi:tetratricopeptide (TPR) repeat protein|nr:CDC27 family protein [Campylobacteraceae bacterium]
MLKTEEIITIEERWKEYKNRILFRKLVAVFLMLIFIASLILLLLVLKERAKINNETDGVKTHYNTSNLEQTSTETVNNITIIDMELQNGTSSDNKTAEITNISAQSVNTTKTVTPIAIDKSNIPKAEINPNSNPPSIKTEQPPVIQEIIAPPIENKIFIETNDIQDIEELIKKFEASNNIVFATMISEEYFDRKNYKKSLEWALRANELDSQNELSWIMFARNQVKLGKREDAIRALEIYTDYAKDATSASNLLKNIKSGEYK